MPCRNDLFYSMINNYLLSTTEVLINSSNCSYSKENKKKSLKAPALNSTITTIIEITNIELIIVVFEKIQDDLVDFLIIFLVQFSVHK
jgi:hypothetical protein